MKRHLPVLACLLLLATMGLSCRDDKQPRVLPEGKMSRVLCDVYLTETILKQPEALRRRSWAGGLKDDLFRDAAYQWILQKHGVTEEEFYASIAHYSMNNRRMSKLYSRVEDLLTAMKESVDRRERQEKIDRAIALYRERSGVVDIDTTHLRLWWSSLHLSLETGDSVRFVPAPGDTLYRFPVDTPRLAAFTSDSLSLDSLTKDSLAMDSLSVIPDSLTAALDSLSASLDSITATTGDSLSALPLDSVVTILEIRLAAELDSLRASNLPDSLLTLAADSLREAWSLDSLRTALIYRQVCTEVDTVALHRACRPYAAFYEAWMESFRLVREATSVEIPNKR